MLQVRRAEGEVPLELSASGDVGRRHRQLVVEKVDRLLETLDATPTKVRIRLDHAADPAHDRPAMARVAVDLPGRPIRARVAAETMDEAISLVERRLQDQLEHLAEHRRARSRRGATSGPGVWRRGDHTPPRPDHHPRPAEQREIVRHKTFTTQTATVEEAVYDLEAMDYDFFLFTDLERGTDALVERADDGRFRVRHLDGAAATPLVEQAVDVEQVAQPAPVLSESEAQAQLDLTGEPWLFHADPQTGRGRVLYRRYDGHYGLITPREGTG